LVFRVQQKHDGGRGPAHGAKYDQGNPDFRGRARGNVFCRLDANELKNSQRPGFRAVGMAGEGRVPKSPPFYHEYWTDGGHYGYVRVGRRGKGSNRIRITHPLGTPGFQPAYEAAIDALDLRDKVNRRNRIVVDEHNAARWLAVAWVDAPPDHQRVWRRDSVSIIQTPILTSDPHRPSRSLDAERHPHRP
jgi:hypothetical protein